MVKTQKTGRKELRRLERLADRLYQIKVIKLKPKSIISGEPTEVIHHFCPKSQSNNLRYDIDNGIPLTNKEHARHHLSGDPSIVATIVLKMGQDWYNSLQKKRHIICKNNKAHLLEIIETLT